MKKSSGSSYERGYQTGFDIGYPVGRQQGISEFYQYFNGFSIIIPSCNQEERLRSGLESIFAQYPELYEVFVVCQGTLGGSDRYLYSLQGKAKIKLLETDLGYAAAVNQGLRMARGDSLLIISEEAATVDGWLLHLLPGYQGQPKAGLEHPPGFSMQMSKDVFRKLGYLDESYETHEAAVEEYSRRARQLGLKLIITGTAHNQLDGSFFSLDEGRGDPENTVAESQAAKPKQVHYHDLYPSHVIVKGCGETRYWIEDGFRLPIEQGADLAAVRVSQIELKKWPQGPMLTKDDFVEKAATISSIPSPYGPIAEGVLVRDRRGVVYQSLKGKLRRFAEARTQEVWGLAKRPVYAISDDVFKQYSEGNPVSVPPVIRSSNL